MFWDVSVLHYARAYFLIFYLYIMSLHFAESKLSATGDTNTVAIGVGAGAGVAVVVVIIVIVIAVLLLQKR